MVWPRYRASPQLPNTATGLGVACHIERCPLRTAPSQSESGRIALPTKRVDWDSVGAMPAVECGATGRRSRDRSTGHLHEEEGSQAYHRAPWRNAPGRRSSPSCRVGGRLRRARAPLLRADATPRRSSASGDRPGPSLGAGRDHDNGSPHGFLRRPRRGPRRERSRARGSARRRSGCGRGPCGVSRTRRRGLWDSGRTRGGP